MCPLARKGTSLSGRRPSGSVVYLRTCCFWRNRKTSSQPLKVAGSPSLQPQNSGPLISNMSGVENNAWHSAPSYYNSPVKTDLFAILISRSSNSVYFFFTQFHLSLYYAAEKYRQYLKWCAVLSFGCSDLGLLVPGCRYTHYVISCLRMHAAVIAGEREENQRLCAKRRNAQKIIFYLFTQESGSLLW